MEGNGEIRKFSSSSSSNGDLFQSSSTGDAHIITRKLKLLRIGVFLLLSIMIAAIGSISYLLLRTIEDTSFTRIFNSSAFRIAQIININLQTKLLTGAAISTLYQQENDKVNISPNLTLPSYIYVMKSLSELAHLRKSAFSPIITNRTRKGWEEYTQSQSSVIFPPGSNFSYPWNLSNGIYCVNSVGQRVYDSGYSPNSKYPHILVPVWQVAPVSGNMEILFNLHSESFREKALDQVISTKLPVFTDLVHSILGDVMYPSTSIYTPVLDKNNHTVIGIVTTPLSWNDAFNNVLPSYISGIYFVLSTSTQTYTYLLKSGNAIFLGPGDLHETKFNHMRKIITQSIPTLLQLSFSDYQITIYPSNELYDAYITVLPIIVSVAFVSIIVITAMVVYVYDYFVRSRARRLIEDITESKIKTKLGDMALRELEMKSSFVRYVSHEVRNPLNIVALGLTHLHHEIEHGRSKEQLLEVTHELEHATNLAVEIMDNLLTFERLTSHVLDLKKETVSVIEYVQECIRPVNLQAGEAGVRIYFTVDASLSESVSVIELDKLKISQVVRNLLSNAIKFSPRSGTVTVSASVAMYEDTVDSSRGTHPTGGTMGQIRSGFEMLRQVISGKHSAAGARREGDVSHDSNSHQLKMKRFLKLCVTDEGPGITSDNQRRLFRDIIQFTPGELQDGKGSGLSLWVSHRVVTLHQGKLHVYSRGLGCGTTFTLELPLLDLEHAQKHPDKDSNLMMKRMVRLQAIDSLIESTSHALIMLAGGETRSAENLSGLDKSEGTKTDMRTAGGWLEDSYEGIMSGKSHRTATGSMKLSHKDATTDTNRRGSHLQTTGKFSRHATEEEEGMDTGAVASHWKRDDHAVDLEIGSKMEEESMMMMMMTTSSQSRLVLELSPKKGTSTELGTINKDLESPVKGCMRKTPHNIAMHARFDATTTGQEPAETITVPVEDLPLKYAMEQKEASPGYLSSNKAIDIDEEEGDDEGDADDYFNRVYPRIDEGARVLVVDDVSMNRKMLIRIIHDTWKHVQEAEDGIVAVDRVKEAMLNGHPFDLILMDFQMPNMNGPEAAKLMREDGFTGLIIGVTGNGLPADIDYFTAQGANHVILKPIKLKTLQSSVVDLHRSYLDGTQDILML